MEQKIISPTQQSLEIPMPSPNLQRFFFLGLLGLSIGFAVLAYIWFSGGSGKASEPITAPIIELAAGDNRSLFSIVSQESEARFIIDEILLGSPYTVVGTTEDVAGEMLIDWQNPANSLLGAIRINLRTLTTDNEFRNRAIRGQILQSEQAEYEFAEFVPTALEALPETLAIGDSMEFQILGYLSLHDINQELRFDARVTALSANRIEGLAWTTIRYTDFGLSIPEAAGVANVSETLRLELEFVATSHIN